MANNNLDKDFLGNKINVGDKVILEAPDYRAFVIGTVITKAPKSCQIEYVNTWNFPDGGRELVVRQSYAQIIKHTDAESIKTNAIKAFAEVLKAEMSDSVSCEKIDKLADDFLNRDVK